MPRANYSRLMPYSGCCSWSPIERIRILWPDRRCTNVSRPDDDRTTTSDGTIAACCYRSASVCRFSSAARWRAAISSSARRFASMRTWE